MTRKPLWDILSDKEKQDCLERIIAHFQDERGERIGVIAAEQVLDVILEPIVKSAYNKGLSAAKELLQDKFADINLDLDLLQQDQG